MKVNLRSRYNVSTTLTIDASELPALVVGSTHQHGEGQIEVLKLQVTALSDILGRLVNHLAKTPGEALELSGVIRHTHWVLEEPRK